MVWSEGALVALKSYKILGFTIVWSERFGPHDGLIRGLWVALWLHNFVGPTTVKSEGFGSYDDLIRGQSLELVWSERSRVAHLNLGGIHRIHLVSFCDVILVVWDLRLLRWFPVPLWALRLSFVPLPFLQRAAHPNAEINTILLFCQLPLYSTNALLVGCLLCKLHPRVLRKQFMDFRSISQFVLSMYLYIKCKIILYFQLNKIIATSQQKIRKR